MKATGKTLAEIRQAVAEWDRDEALSPVGTPGVFFAPRQGNSESPGGSRSGATLTITDAHRAVAKAIGRTPEEIARAEADVDRA